MDASEILGLHVTSAEDGAGWLAFFRDLTARGLSGVKLVTSDAHRGLVEAIGATLPEQEEQLCQKEQNSGMVRSQISRSFTPPRRWQLDQKKQISAMDNLQRCE